VPAKNVKDATFGLDAGHPLGPGAAPLARDTAAARLEVPRPEEFSQIGPGVVHGTRGLLHQPLLKGRDPLRVQAVKGQAGHLADQVVRLRKKEKGVTKKKRATVFSI